MRKIILLCSLCCVLDLITGNPQANTILSPLPITMLWDIADEFGAEAQLPGAAVEQEHPVGHDWVQGLEPHVPIPSAVQLGCLCRLAVACERNFRCSQCCTRMYKEPHGQRDWYYPCCFCVYDQLDYPCTCENADPLRPFTGANGICLPDCCLRHTGCWRDEGYLGTTVRERTFVRTGCLVAFECFLLGCFVRGQLD